MRYKFEREYDRIAKKNETDRANDTVVLFFGIFYSEFWNSDLFSGFFFGVFAIRNFIFWIFSLIPHETTIYYFSIDLVTRHATLCPQGYQMFLRDANANDCTDFEFR